MGRSQRHDHRTNACPYHACVRRYIIYDTSRLIQRFEPDEYIDAAIQLYLDILNLFLYILRILSKLKGKK